FRSTAPACCALTKDTQLPNETSSCPAFSFGMDTAPLWTVSALIVRPSCLKRSFSIGICDPEQSITGMTPRRIVVVSSLPPALAVVFEASWPEPSPPKRPQPAVRSAAKVTARSPPARTDPRLARPTLPGRFIILPSPALNYVRRSALGRLLIHGL